MVKRRAALKAIGSIPFAAIGANAVAENADESRVSISTWLGDAQGYLAQPKMMPAPGVVLIHEWWGLNDQIKQTADMLADEGFFAVAVDLYGGEVAKTPDAARSLMQNVTPDEALEILVTWVDWMRDYPGSNGKVGTLGWCFGGGWSLNASIATPVDATVIYYGRCDKGAEETAQLQGPVMGHFATQDNFIDMPMVARFEKSMDASDKSYQNFWYEADHAFANPTSARHDQEDAKLAWMRTVDFLRENLA